MRRALIALALAFTAVALFEAGHSRLLNLPHQLTDFRTFYCGGVVADADQDPYRVQPLSACEHALGGLRVLLRNPTVTIPMPAPGYDLAAFRLLAYMPFVLAALLWTVLEVAAVGVSIWLLWRQFAVHPVICTGALALSAGLASIVQGQLMPFEVLAIIGSGYALARGRDLPAGILAVCTCIEPHIGLPICASLFLFCKNLRATLAIGFLVLIAVTLVTIGPAEALEYLRSVTRAQVLSEAAYQEQYSLTYVLAFIGVAKPAAVLLGMLSYAIASAAGIIAGRILAQREGATAALVFAPAAASVLGGPYVHVTQVCAAIPLAILLAALPGSGRRSTLLAISTALLAVPWPYPYATKQLFLISIAACAAILMAGAHGRRLAWRIAALCALAILLDVVENRPRIVNAPVPLKSYAATDLAQASWTDYVSVRETRDATFFFLKILTWAGLLGVCVVTYRSCAQRPFQIALLPRREL